jgi:hypothetical protein
MNKISFLTISDQQLQLLADPTTTATTPSTTTSSTTPATTTSSTTPSTTTSSISLPTTTTVARNSKHYREKK